MQDPGITFFHVQCDRIHNDSINTTISQKKMPGRFMKDEQRIHGMAEQFNLVRYLFPFKGSLLLSCTHFNDLTSVFCKHKELILKNPGLKFIFPAVFKFLKGSSGYDQHQAAIL